MVGASRTEAAGHPWASYNIGYHIAGCLSRFGGWFVRVAYLINQYPKISHAFIRREILALERSGLDVTRFALRGWDAEVVDAEDRQEREQTRYVLQQGTLPLFVALLRALLTSPVRFWAALRLSLSTGRWSDRPLVYHLVYLAEACRLLPWLKDCGAAHVHAHFGTNAAEVVMLARTLGGPPYSITVHGPEEFDKPHALNLGEKIRRSAFTVAISSFARSQIFRWIERTHWQKVNVVHCGIEPAFHEGPISRVLPAPRLVCLGRLSAEKGQLLLVEAATLLAAKGLPFEVTLVGDGPMRSTIEALVIARGLGDRFKLTGSISTERLREELLGARALVLPSFAEGLPMVIMEAMALRRPILTTWIAGIPELVRDGIDGWLIPAGSIQSLAAAMEDCLCRPVEDLWAMGESARARVLERHSVDDQALQLNELFRHAAGTEPV
jgi:colanic acid/amylovoran biosynthesis glycosyltransferase